MFFAKTASAVLIAAMASTATGNPTPFHPAPVPVHPVVHPVAPVHGYAEPPKPYAFEYGVHDDYSGANFDQVLPQITNKTHSKGQNLYNVQILTDCGRKMDKKIQVKPKII